MAQRPEEETVEGGSVDDDRRGRWITCTACSGTGRYVYQPEEDCEACSGIGEVYYLTPVTAPDEPDDFAGFDRHEDPNGEPPPRKP